MKKPVSEILRIINELPIDQRQDALAFNVQNQGLIQILKYMFDPTIVFDLPEGNAPYKPNEFLDAENNLYGEIRRLYLFTDPNSKLTPLKKQALWIQLLEFVSKEDARFLNVLKEKKCIYPNITFELVNRTFPGLLTPVPEAAIKAQERQEKKANKVEQPVHLQKVHQKIFSCPFGCSGTNGKNDLYSAGNISNHLVNKHSWTKEQVEKERNSQRILMESRKF